MRVLRIEDPSDSEQRIDKFLKKYLLNASLGSIYKWLRTGKIKVNKKKVDQTYRIEMGDEIHIHIQEEELNILQKEEKEDISIANKIHLEVLYEDEYFLVINKPSGMNVHPGDHKTTEVSLIELVQDML